MKASGCCGRRMGSVAALKYSVVGLYLLVLLILVGIFILAGEAGPAPPGALPEPGASMGLEFRLGRVSRAIQGEEKLGSSRTPRSAELLGIRSLSPFRLRAERRERLGFDPRGWNCCRV